MDAYLHMSQHLLAYSYVLVTHIHTYLHACTHVLITNYHRSFHTWLFFFYCEAPWKSKIISSFYRWKNPVCFLLGSEHVWPLRCSVMSYGELGEPLLRYWQEHSRGCSEAHLKLTLVPNTRVRLELVCPKEEEDTSVIATWESNPQDGWTSLQLSLRYWQSCYMEEQGPRGKEGERNWLINRCVVSCCLFLLLSLRGSGRCRIKLLTAHMQSPILALEFITDDAQNVVFRHTETAVLTFLHSCFFTFVCCGDTYLCYRFWHRTCFFL